MTNPVNFKFENIVINSKNEITEKIDSSLIDFKKEAIIFCLLTNKQITINRKNYNSGISIVEQLSPFDIFDKIDL